MRNKLKQREYARLLIQRNPWLVSYYKARERCIYKNHPSYKHYGAKGIKFLMSKEDFKLLWFRDRANLMKKPTIDRVDSGGDYVLSNCRYIEWLDNCFRNYSRKFKSVDQFTLDGVFVKRFESLADACRAVGRYRNGNSSSISNCVRGRRPSAHGYIWRSTENNAVNLEDSVKRIRRGFRLFKCSSCGKEFEDYPSKKREKCSKKCHDESMRKK